MNKLIVSDIINLNSGKYHLNFKNNESIININGEVTIYILDEVIEKLIFNLEDNSRLNVYKYDRVLKNNIYIIINENNNTIVNFNSNYTNKDNVILKIDNNINGNVNESNIKIRNVSKNGNSKIIVNVNIEKNTMNNIALEDLKGINNGGCIEIEPNIICSTNEVSANHLTTIGSFDKESINYLISKGLTEIKAKELLLKGFISSNLDSYIKECVGGEFNE